MERELSLWRDLMNPAREGVYILFRAKNLEEAVQLRGFYDNIMTAVLHPRQPKKSADGKLTFRKVSFTFQMGSERRRLKVPLPKRKKKGERTLFRKLLSLVQKGRSHTLFLVPWGDVNRDEHYAHCAIIVLPKSFPTGAELE